ncbi:tyrosine-protein kinase-like otk isoform X2 [Stylophora pistillata]|uniref:tyrosine-protein kinase-like otk isoform X2 n=1 Tax=Stylophora pistillata TaxID=50429 RepID=UPI000C0531EE|nr:tyrosine-protein kinase-like otk isoform X2 [Stylophora pistillata]
MMVGDSWLGKATKWVLLLTIAGTLWNLPFVRSETCNSKKIRPVVYITTSPENYNLTVGASIMLICEAEPRTIDTGYLDRWVKYIQWYDPQDREVGAKCQQPSSVYEYKRRLSCPLVLKNLTVDEFGIYTCQAGNPYKNHCTRHLITLGSAPEFVEAPMNQSVTINSTATFHCAAKGLPLPTIHWIKDNKSHHIQSNHTHVARVVQDDINNSSLEITKAKKNGRYQCIAKNVVGVKESGVAFLIPKNLEKLEDPKNKSHSTGSTVIFSCNATAQSKPNMKWIKNNPRLKLTVTPDATECQSIQSIKFTNEKMEEVECRTEDRLTTGKRKSKLASLHTEEEITETRPQESSTTQIAIVIAASCVVATLVINGVLGLLWYKRYKGGNKFATKLTPLKKPECAGLEPKYLNWRDSETSRGFLCAMANTQQS